MKETHFNIIFAVLGAGGNTFSEIRRKLKSSPLKTVKRSNLLSVLNVLPVLIRITDGL